MKKTRPTTYKTLEGLRRQLTCETITGEQMANMRAHFNDGWHYKFKVTERVENEFWNGIAHVIWRKPSERQIRLLRYAETWMLRRMLYTSSNRFQYCAGQDYPYEIRSIQNYVNKL